MFAAVKGVVRKIFNYSRLWLPAPSPPERSQRSPSPPPVRFCELPLEMLAMILEELDWRDILRIRETCSALQEVSKTRSIWLKLCGPYLAPTATAPQILHLERPLKLYKSRDLEFLFLRMKSAEIGWKTDDKSPSRRREIVTTNTAKYMYLVEGGRWLLIVSPTGSISYFDLDDSTPTENILIPDQFDLPVHHQLNPLTEVAIVMAVDMNNDSMFLAFNLVVSFSVTGIPPPDPKAHSIHIWRVALVLDDQLQGIGLTAEPLASFPLEPSIGGIFCQSIRGPHLALSLLSNEHEDCQLTFIIDWKQADGDQTNYPRRLLHPPDGREPEAIHLLPGNKIFTAAHEGVMIFDYLSIPETTSLPPFDFTDVTAMPLWKDSSMGLSLGLQECSVSQPFFCSCSVRFSIVGGDDIHGVAIDYPYNEDPTVPLAQVVKLMEKIDTSDYCERYGYNKAAILANRAETYLLCYPWPDQQNHNLSPVSLQKGLILETRCQFGPLLDEESGRVIISTDVVSRAKHSHDIWDFALLHK